MPVEPPHVAVLSDPTIVFIFVALFAGALALALLFASPWLSGVPTAPAREAAQDPNEGTAGAAVPWSTAPSENQAPRHARADRSEHD